MEQCPDTPRAIPRETPAEIRGAILRVAFKGIPKETPRGIFETKS